MDVPRPRHDAEAGRFFEELEMRWLWHVEIAKKLLVNVITKSPRHAANLVERHFNNDLPQHLIKVTRGPRIATSERKMRRRARSLKLH
jgi:hypothetical protein